MFLDDSFIFSEIVGGSVGNSGDIVIGAGFVELLNGSQIFTLSSGQGNSGDIVINTDGDISLSGIDSDGVNSLIATATTQTGVGNSGRISIAASNIFLSDGGGIFSGTFGEGNGGNIDIQASGNISIQGADSTESLFDGISTSVSEGAIGDGGNISISTTDLSISNGGVIDVSTAGIGDGGSVNVSTNNLTLNNGGAINASTSNEGNGGNILVNSNLVDLVNNAQINANSNGEGAAGSIFVGATDLKLDSSFISATNRSASFSIPGGDTNLQIEDTLFISNNGSISTEAFGNASAGNITIDARFILGRQNDIQSVQSLFPASEQGNSGNINISAEFILGLNLRIIGESTVIVDTNDQPENVVESEQTIAQACQANREALAQGGLTIEGKGGVPAEPGLPLNSLNVTVNGETNTTSTIPQPIETSQGKIQPARGIKVMKSGEVILTSYRTNNSGDRLLEIKPNCS